LRPSSRRRRSARLARHLRAEGITVTEVGRPKRQRRARYGKSDDADAAGAAAIVLAGEALGEPKSADGAAEMVRVLRVARTSAVRARAKAYTALQDLLVTAPAELREQRRATTKAAFSRRAPNSRRPKY